jgi:ATP-dependent exoDNAse (exonuclease V) beta subunit
MTAATTPDQAQRDRIAGSIDETLFVDAGAGSGKTTMLVARVVELVRTGVAIDAIAAITFTEAAAAELRARVRAALRDAVAAAPPGAEADLMRAALDNVDAASIQTLHSFAQSILRAHPIAAGLPPSLEVADEISSALAFEERFTQFRDDLLADGRWTPILRRFLMLDMRFDHLRELAQIFNENWDRLPVAWSTPQEPPAVLPSLAVERVLAPLHEALDLRHRCSDDTDKLARHLDGCITDVVAAFESTRGDHLLRLLADKPRLTFGHGQAPNWGGADMKQRVVDLLQQASDARDVLRNASVRAMLAAMSPQVGWFVLDAAEQRRRSGRLEYHDLLVRARDVLRAHQEVREQLNARYQHVLVDEFQDTDPLQIEIVSLICAPPEEPRPWNAARIDEGRVFFVGDPKQSIYRFRRADIGLYTDARARFADGLCALSANFRTVPGIIDWVNIVFGQLMDTTDERVQPRYLALDAVRPPISDGRAPITVLGGPIDAKMNEIRAISAIDLAHTIRTMVTEQHSIIDGGVERPVDFGDIVVLVPSRLVVGSLEDAFDVLEVPYRLESSSLIWASQEVRDVLAILRAVADPGDRLAIVAALRTPMLGCSDRELAEWAATGGRWSYLGDSNESDQRAVARGLRLLAELNDRRWWVGPDGLIEHLATELCTFQFGLLAGRRRDRWRRLRYVADQARAFVESQRGDLAAFVRWCGLQASDIVRVSAPTLPEADQQAVRVMTIHASKGLEFPVVALAGLGSPPPSKRGVSVVWGTEAPEVRFGAKGETEGYQELVPAEEQMDAHERIRLLYVAATRARDRLILCLHHPQKGSGARNSFGSIVVRHQPEGRDDLWVAPAEPGVEMPEPPPLEIPDQLPTDAPEVVEVLAERDAFVATRAALLASDHRAVWSATAVAKAAAPEVVDTEGELDDQPDDQRVWRRGRAGTAIGRAVHGTLQLVDFTDLSDLDAIARSQAAAEGVDDAIGTVAGLARSGARAPVIGELTARRHWREMYVSAPIGGSVVEGYVDLLAEDGNGGLVVLDYKTDTVRNDAEVEERTERYRLQAATYALAIEAVTDRSVTRASFLFLGTSGAIEATVDDLEAAKAEARAVLNETT